MPIFVEEFSTQQTRIMLGTKADFIKLQVKHAVVGEDSEDIRKAVEKIEKITPKMSEIRDYVRPHDELTKAVKAFKTKYSKKHPKFISAVETEFVEPVDQIIEQGKDWIKQTSTLPKYFTETLAPIDDIVDTLSNNQLSDAVLETALKQLAAVGSSYNNALSNLTIVANAFKIDSLKKIKDAGQDKRPVIQNIDRILQGAQKTQNYTVDLKGVVGALGDLARTCKVLAAAVEKVGT